MASASAATTEGDPPADNQATGVAGESSSMRSEFGDANQRVTATGWSP